MIGRMAKQTIMTSLKFMADDDEESREVEYILRPQ